MKLTYASSGVETEPLKSAFGFKGNALTCLWQAAVQLRTEEFSAVGLGVQSVLWSDAKVFRSLGEEAGNVLMYDTTKYSLQLLRGLDIQDPAAAMEQIFEQSYAYAVLSTGFSELSRTFVRNALVSVDMALWQLWLKEQHLNGFDSIWTIPHEKQNSLANIPLITYSTPISEVVHLAQNNAPLLKIKIGADPSKNGAAEDMLQWDKERLLEIHRAVKDIPVTHTDCGHVLYYLDANGRYGSRQTLEQLLDFAHRQRILERIILLEEPFSENSDVYVGDLPVCVAADESVHGMEELKRRKALGYGALTLKPIAKGISLSLEMAKYALACGMDCFCADLTVNPLMVTWNQCVAARLPRLPGLKVGIVESNGGQNYRNWEQMKACHPMAGSAFLQERQGIYRLDEQFYHSDGGIFEDSPHYRTLSSREVAEFD